MIYRRYGTSFQSVDLNFDSKALNEIGFRRNRESSVAADVFGSRYELVETVELVAEAEGDVQDHTEQELLDRLEGRIQEVRQRLTDGDVIVVENEQGHDYPKTRQQTSTVVAGGENRLRFTYTISPPLRVGVYRPRERGGE